MGEVYLAHDTALDRNVPSLRVGAKMVTFCVDM